MKKKKFEITEAKLSDIEGVREIYSHYVKNTVSSLEEIVPYLDQMVDVYSSIIAKNLPYLVAKEGDKVIGYCYVSPYRTRSAYRYTLEDSIYIHPDHLGQGAARALLGQVIEKSKEIGYKQIVAVVVSESDDSVKFHQAMGFEIKGRLEKIGFKFGKWLDSIIMQREL